MTINQKLAACHLETLLLEPDTGGLPAEGLKFACIVQMSEFVNVGKYFFVSSVVAELILEQSHKFDAKISLVKS